MGGRKGGKKNKPRKKSFRSWKNYGNPGDDAAGSAYSTSRAQKQFQSRVSEGRSGFHGGGSGQSYSDFRAQQSEANKARLRAEAKAREAAKKAEETRKRTFDPSRLSTTFNLKNYDTLTGQSFLTGGFQQPGRLGSWFDKGLNKRVPNEATASFGRLFRDDISQLGKFTDKRGGE